MPLRSRRKAREAALQALYQMEVGDVKLSEVLEDVRSRGGLEEDQRSFAEEVVARVAADRKRLESVLAAHLEGWSVDRLATIDRLLLLSAIFELLERPDIPQAVTMNEAVELAKKYSTAESGAFVNGVLAKIAAAYPKPPIDASIAEQPTPPSPPVPEDVLREGDEALAQVREHGAKIAPEEVGA